MRISSLKVSLLRCTWPIAHDGNALRFVGFSSLGVVNPPRRTSLHRSLIAT